MNSSHPQRLEIIQKLKNYFSEFDHIHCTEHAIAVESGLVGFASACELLNAISEEEHAQIRKSLLKCRHEANIPPFLNDAESNAGN